MNFRPILLSGGFTDGSGGAPLTGKANAASHLFAEYMDVLLTNKDSLPANQDILSSIISRLSSLEGQGSIDIAALLQKEESLTESFPVIELLQTLFQVPEADVNLQFGRMLPDGTEAGTQPQLLLREFSSGQIDNLLNSLQQLLVGMKRNNIISQPAAADGEFRENLSVLLDKVQQGEEVAITIREKDAELSITFVPQTTTAGAQTGIEPHSRPPLQYVDVLIERSASAKSAEPGIPATVSFLPVEAKESSKIPAPNTESSTPKENNLFSENNTNFAKNAKNPAKTGAPDSAKTMEPLPSGTQKTDTGEKPLSRPTAASTPAAGSSAKGNGTGALESELKAAGLTGKEIKEINENLSVAKEQKAGSAKTQNNEAGKNMEAPVKTPVKTAPGNGATAKTEEKSAVNTAPAVKTAEKVEPRKAPAEKEIQQPKVMAENSQKVEKNGVVPGKGSETAPAKSAAPEAKAEGVNSDETGKASVKTVKSEPAAEKPSVAGISSRKESTSEPAGRAFAAEKSADSETIKGRVHSSPEETIKTENDEKSLKFAKKAPESAQNAPESGKNSKIRSEHVQVKTAAESRQPAAETKHTANEIRQPVNESKTSAPEIKPAETGTKRSVTEAKFQSAETKNPFPEEKLTTAGEKQTVQPGIKQDIELKHPTGEGKHPAKEGKVTAPGMKPADADVKPMPPEGKPNPSDAKPNAADIKQPPKEPAHPKTAAELPNTPASEKEKLVFSGEFGEKSKNVESGTLPGAHEAHEPRKNVKHITMPGRGELVVEHTEPQKAAAKNETPGFILKEFNTEGFGQGEKAGKAASGGETKTIDTVMSEAQRPDEKTGKVFEQVMGEAQAEQKAKEDKAASGTNGSAKSAAEEAFKTVKPAESSGQFSDNFNKPEGQRPAGEILRSSGANVEKYVRQIEVVREVGRFIAKNKPGSLTLRVTPKALGTVKIMLDTVGNALKATIQVENDKVKKMLESDINVLMRNADQKGMHLTSVQISVHSADFKQQLKMNQAKKKDDELKNEEKVEKEETPSEGKKLGYNTVEYLA